MSRSEMGWRRWLLRPSVGVGAVVVVGLVVVIAARPAWLVRGWDAATSAFRSDEQTAATRLAWQVGVEEQYAFQLDTAVKHGPSRADLMNVKLRGQLAIAGIEPGSLRLQFTGEVVELAGAESDEEGTEGQGQGLSDQLKAPFYAYFDERGRLLKVQTAPGAYDFVTRLWHGTVAALQFVGPSSVEQDRWTTVEADTVGEYDAAYEKLAPAKYAKQKQQYHPGALKNSQITYAIDQSRTTFQLSDKQALQSLQLDERLGVLNAPVFGSMQTTTRISLTRQGDRRVAQLLAEWLKQARSAQLESPSSDLSADLDRARTQGMEWSDILASLRRLNELQDPSEQDRNLLGRARIALKATLRLHPEQVETAEQGVLEGGPLAREFLNALRDANTPQATGALVRLARNPSFDSKDRLRVATALSLTKAATAESLETLRELRDDPAVREQATFGVGSAVHSLAQSGDSAAQDGLSYLVSELTKSESEYEGRALLEALGNAGQADSLPVIAKYTQESSPRLRGGAAQALRRIDSPAADELLAQLLQDSDAKVRGLALDALSGRGPSAVVASHLPRVILEDSAAGNRIRAIRLAGAWRASYPDLSQAVQSAAANDPERAVREAAERALAGT